MPDVPDTKSLQTQLTYTVSEVAQLLGYHKKTVLRAIQRGTLKASRIGGRRGGFRISRAELAAWWKAAGGGELFDDDSDEGGADG